RVLPLPTWRSLLRVCGARVLLRGGGRRGLMTLRGKSSARSGRGCFRSAGLPGWRGLPPCFVGPDERRSQPLLGQQSAQRGHLLVRRQGDAEVSEVVRRKGVPIEPTPAVARRGRRKSSAPQPRKRCPIAARQRSVR